MTPVRVRRAAPFELEIVLDLLRDAGLPLSGVRDHFATFFVAEHENRIVGAIGLEDHGATALLRSAVVTASARGRGIGSALVNALLEHAQARGIEAVVLLTTTAEEYFSRQGFRRIDRTSLPPAVQTSEEFRGACPDTAACMELRLAAGPGSSS